MARPLPLSLDEISRGNTSKSQPAWQLFVYDVRSGQNTVADVALGNTLALRTGPLDATEFAQTISVNERAGGYVEGNVASIVINCTLVDPNGQFDPQLLIDDPDALARFFRKGNVVRLVRGDERVAQTDWVNVFTGRIAGQVGYDDTRAPLRREIVFKAYGREATFLPFERTSSEFKNDGTTYLQMGESVAQNEMGLQTGEFNFFGWGTNLVRHKSVTLANENPLSMLAKIMFVDGFLPKFDGSGVLSQSSGLVTGNSDRFYETDDGVLSIRRIENEVVPPDAVCVTGLDFNQTRVNQPFQVIGELNVTTGYFTDGERLEIYWSDDRTKLADSVFPQVLKSVNGGLPIPLGGGEVFFPIVSPSTNSVGTVGYSVIVDTGFAPWVAVFFLTIYVGLSAVPNLVVVAGLGVSTGSTINVGSIAAAAALTSALIILTKLGRGQYRFYGSPFEFVYETIRECAVAEGAGEFDRVEVEIENHLVDNRPQAAVIAREILFRQAARGRPRDIVMLYDLGLEPDDTMELLVSGRRFLVEQISYTLDRNNLEASAQARVRAYEVTTNAARAT